jgi:hypothetical protein
VNKKMNSDIFFQHSPVDLPKPKKVDHLSSDIFGIRRSASAASVLSPATSTSNSIHKKNSNISHVFDAELYPDTNAPGIVIRPQKHDWLSSDIFYQRPASHTEPLVRKSHRQQPKGEITSFGDPKFSAFRERGTFPPISMHSCAFSLPGSPQFSFFVLPFLIASPIFCLSLHFQRKNNRSMNHKFERL